jgi:D-alanyl-D-alanine carboxypeptidase
MLCWLRMNSPTQVRLRTLHQHLPATLVVVVVVVALLEVFLLWYLHTKNVEQDEQLVTLRTEYASSTTYLMDELYILENALEEVTTKNISLADALDAERDRVEDLRDEVGDFERSVETLEKLSETDQELLQKYSKVYFLNEHYTPPDVTVIDSKYDFPNDREVAVHSDMWPFLEDLLDDAWDDGEEMYVLSGYRSFDEQNALKGQYTVQYGAGSANSFSADQGYSEHQLGTTIDFTTKEIGPALTGFETTSAYRWLRNNAYKYGFILSYPDGNGHYIFEPWHWRFVGKSLARYLDRRNESFYDLDQRKIDTYLVKLFD